MDQLCNTGNKVSSRDFHWGDTEKDGRLCCRVRFFITKNTHDLGSSTELLFYHSLRGSILHKNFQFNLEATNSLKTQHGVRKDHKIFLIWLSNNVYGEQKSVYTALPWKCYWLLPLQCVLNWWVRHMSLGMWQSLISNLNLIDSGVFPEIQNLADSLTDFGRIWICFVARSDVQYCTVTTAMRTVD